MKLRFLDVLICYLILVMSSCTASAKKDGVCARSCGSRPIGGGKLRGVALTQAVSFSKCTVGQDLPSQKYHFLVYEDTALPDSSDQTKQQGNFPTRIPKAGIAFVPIVPGWNTVETPESDLCTDSCGVAEITFTPKCAEQDVSIGILVPGMLYDDGKESIPSIKFSVSFE